MCVTNPYLNGLSDAITTTIINYFTLLDFKGKSAVLLPAKINMTAQLIKVLAASYSNEKYGIQAMEDEIISTLSIEQIDSSRESVRRILNGGAPETSNARVGKGLRRSSSGVSFSSRRGTGTSRNLSNN